MFKACEPAGPGFDFSLTTMPPQKAAKNVACVHTSALAGTFRRDCHQDWIMGQCGRHQPADNFWKFMYCTFSNSCDSSEYYSHGLCPNFFNSAFKNDFVNNNFYNCGSLRHPIGAPNDFKMGYMESRRTWASSSYWMCNNLLKVSSLLDRTLWVTFLRQQPSTPRGTFWMAPQ